VSEHLFSIYRVKLVGLLFCALLIFGFELIQAFAVVFTVFVQWAIGCVLLSVFWKSDRDLIAREAVGLSLGLGLFGLLVPFISPIALLLSFSALCTLLALISRVVMKTSSDLRKMNESIPRRLGNSISLDLVVFVMATYLAGIARSTLLFSIVSACFILLAKHFQSKFQQWAIYSIRITAYGLISVAVYLLSGRIVSVDIVPGRDNLYLGGQSISIAQYGLDAITGIGIPLKYHWLSLSWLGGMAEVVKIDALAAIHVFAPIAASFVIAIVLVHLLSSRGSKPTVVIATALVLVLSNSIHKNQPTIDFEGLSNYLPIVWLLAIVIVAGREFDSQSVRIGILVGVLVGMLTLGQGVFGLVAVVGWTLYWLVNLQREGRAIGNFGRLPTLGIPWVAFLLTFLLLISPSGNQQQSLSIVSLEFPVTLLGSDSIDQLFLIFRVFPIVAVVFLGRLFTLRYPLFSVAAGLSAIVFGSTLNLISYGQERFLITIGVLSALLLPGVLNTQLLGELKSARLVVTSGFLVGLIETVTFIGFRWGGLATRTLTVGLFIIATLFLTGVVCLQSVLSTRRNCVRDHSKRQQVFASAVLLVLAVNVGAGFAHLFRSEIREAVNPSAAEVAGLQSITAAEFKQMKEMSEWIGENTDESSVIATDRHCVEEKVISPTSLQCEEYRYPVLSALSRRQVYVEVGYELHLGFENVPDRLVQSSQFAKTLDAQKAEFLISKGVTHFVLSRSIDNEDHLLSERSVLLANDFAVIIDLKAFVSSQS
jgi:hypothetical protein